MSIQYYQPTDSNETYAQENPIISGILNTAQEYGWSEEDVNKLWSLVSLANTHETVQDVGFFYSLLELQNHHNNLELGECLYAIESETVSTLQDFARMKAGHYLGDEVENAELFVTVDYNHRLIMNFDSREIPFDNAETFLIELGNHIQLFADDNDMEIDADPVRDLTNQQLEAFPQSPNIHDWIAEKIGNDFAWDDTWSVLYSASNEMDLNQYTNQTFTDYVQKWANANLDLKTNKTIQELENITSKPKFN